MVLYTARPTAARRANSSSEKRANPEHRRRLRSSILVPCIALPGPPPPKCVTAFAALFRPSALAHLLHMSRRIIRSRPPAKAHRTRTSGTKLRPPRCDWTGNACRTMLESHGETRRLSIHHLQVAKRLAVQLTPSDLNVFLREAHSQHCLPNTNSAGRTLALEPHRC